MKFTVVVGDGFKAKGQHFEEDNTYDADRQGVSEDDLKRWWQAGFVSVDGWDAPPAPQPGARRIQPQDVVTKAGGK